ncbi:catalase, partial [Streptomyces sp. SID10244]|nr:catalase [Streptomyces sp. SID10244]
QDMVVDFFSCHSAEYELRVQLCASSDRRWIEDATFDWPEEVSPHRTVATVRFDQQDPYTPERRAYGDDVLSFNSWRGLDAHRPLGSINRL